MKKMLSEPSPLLSVSLIFNIFSIGAIVILLTTNWFSKDEGAYTDFSTDFYSLAKDQELYAKSFFYEEVKDRLGGSFIGKPERTEFLRRKPKLPKECRPLKDKRAVKIELGELVLKVNNGELGQVKGLKISRETADSLLVNIFVYDKALSNICIALSKINDPKTEQEFQFILNLMDRQQKIVDAYTSFKLGISQSKTDAEINQKIKENKSNIDQVEKATAGLG